MRKTSGPRRPTRPLEREDNGETRPPVVAIGASAGGLEALKELLQATPPTTGACFIFIQHLDPAHKSMLAELLSRCTQMQVLQASDNLRPQPNTVVLIPPNATLTYADGLLHIEQPAPPRQHRTPIDSFFESIAAELGENGVCVLLSGTGSDGTHGLALVKEAGGLTIVQDPKTAKYDSMPRNAVATGYVDYELAPADIPPVLIDHLQKLQELQANGGVDGLHEQLTSDLAKICGVLRARTSHEFRDYKEGTLFRRIHRRMQVLRITQSEDYVERLREDPSEVGKLLRELLISVTGFFRDPLAFDQLATLVVDPLVSAAEGGRAIRVWVPGCASGEEAYSLAMIIHDRTEAAGKRLKVQLFATDIDERALETARRGCYSEAILARVPERYRSRYFRQDGGDFRVVDTLREMCIFSTQSVIKDPPFSRLDLISCRNLLIYLKPELQNRLIPIFHYALRAGGALFLGPSENVTKHGKLFQTIDSKWRIFRRLETNDLQGRLLPVRSLYGMQEARDRPEVARPPISMGKKPSTVALAERLVLDQLGPAYAVVSQDREVLYTGGGIERYLSIPRGAATQDLLAMTKPHLRMDVRAVMHRAFSDGKQARRSNVVGVDGNKPARVRIVCAPLGQDGGSQTYVLVFHELEDKEPGAPVPAGGDKDSTVEALERELVSTREYLQTTTEELESSNEELKSANEELMSMNEELQSSNEELETSKEELQSVNEELETVNSELAAKVEELSQSNSDLQNLLESLQIATLFLDRNLRVRRFTPKAKELFHLIDSDVGRSITDIVPRFDQPDSEDLVKQVLNTHQTAQARVRLKDDMQTFMMRILPYRTYASAVEGIVATFVDISDIVNAEAAAQRRAAQQDYLASLSGAILRGDSMIDIIQAAPASMAELLNTMFSKILKYRPDSGDFELIACVGFAKSAGNRVEGGSGSQAGFTLQAGEPVIVEDMRTEHRFGLSELLTENAIRSGISTVIPGPNGFWGVLGAHSQVVRSFSTDDVRFIKAVANVISTGLQREEVMRALHESRDRLTSALRAGKLGVHDFDPRTGNVKWDQTVRMMWGVPEDLPITFDVFMSGVHPDDRPMVKAAVDAALDPQGGGHFKAIYRVINAMNNDIRWIRADGDVTFVDGVAVRLVGTVTDISERRRIEQQVQLLMREVNHRAKNLLAVVQSIARQTAKGANPEEFADYLSQRLQGLAASQDLIIRGDWQSVSLADLVRSQISHLGVVVTARIQISGAPLRLTTAAAQGIGLALHELATNALKYGALSNDSGHVEIAWARTGSGMFTISWIEHNGPPVTAPARRGFGSTVIERMAASAVGGDVTLTFEPGGVEWHLAAPEKEVVYDASDGSVFDSVLNIPPRVDGDECAGMC